MSLPDLHTSGSQTNDSAAKWLTILGIGEDGAQSLSDQDKQAISQCAQLIGSKRQLDLVRPILSNASNAVEWRSPLRPHMEEIAAQKKHGTIVLASGDPFFYGIGASFSKLIPAQEMSVTPSISSLSLALAKLQWRFEDCELLSLCGRPVTQVISKLASHHKLLLLSSGPKTPFQLAEHLVNQGFERATLHLLERLGGPKETHTIHTTAQLLDAPIDFDPLHIIGVQLNDQTSGHPPMPRTAGLANELFDHDGQITKCEIRAITLAKLAPRPNQILWDIGLGSGAISIEWLRLAQGTTAVGFEKDETRAKRAAQNAAKFGLTGLTIHQGAVCQILGNLDRTDQHPDAIFIGGGLNDFALIETLVGHLKQGGHLVANGVTTKTEAILLQAFAQLGGEMARIQISTASPVGALTAWRPAMPILQWVYRKEAGLSTQKVSST